jgi:predicted amidohydrolase YtcJ
MTTLDREPMNAARRRRSTFCTLASLVVTALAACSAPESMDEVTMVIRNGRVWTGLTDGSGSATAVAIAGGRISAVGSDADVASLIGPATRIVDARGGLIAPGFIDSHVHFLTGGYRLSSVQLRNAATPEEFADRISAFAASVARGTWITGGDWDHENWGGALPTAEWVDARTPDHPVMVHRLDGHMILANSAAMRRAGVDATTPDVDGGEIVRDSSGRPTGVFKDNAIDLIAAVVPDPPSELDDRAVDAAMRYVAEQGVTSVHHMGGFGELEVFRRAQEEGRLLTRILACTPLSQWERLAEYVAASGRGDEWLSWGCLKGFVDGSLGSHTAAFFEPFTDAPDDVGFFVNSKADLLSWISAGDARELQVDVHAIGDRAISTLLDIFEEVEAEAGPRDRRFRIEHAQHLVASDFERFARLDVIASMQPYHAIDDGRWAEKVIGPERIKTTYAFRSFLDNDIVLAFGSDWFVAPPTPLEGLYAAVTRRTLDDANPEGWVPEQRIALDQALTAYTRSGAYASFEEGTKGTLAPGMLADVVVVDRDLFAIAPEAIRDARVVMTIVGGSVVFERRPQ